MRKPTAARQGRLVNQNNDLVPSEARADTVAQHFETVQWRTRTASLIDEPALGATLPIDVAPFCMTEVKCALRKLRNAKTPGPDSTPPEYWKALSYSQDALQQVTDFANECWSARRVPAEWHTAFVIAVHKKGRTDVCENYRPISLLNIGYKVFASLTHARLTAGGVEERLTES